MVEYYWVEEEDDFEGRNARSRAVVTPGRPVRGVPARTTTTVVARPAPPPAMQAYPYPPPGYGPAYPTPWGGPPPVPMQPATVISTETTKLPRIGIMVDAAAQILAAMAGLPASPSATGEAKTDMTNLITYQSSLAQHAKRDEQIRTAGKLARLFLG